jgi:hypothetical protein
MASTNLIRLGGLAAMLAGVTFIFDELFVFTVFHGEWIMAVWIVGPLLMVVGLLGLHALQKDNYGRVGRGGFWVVVVASLVQVVGTVVPLQMSNVLYWPVYGWGAWAVPAGLIIYGVATLQAKVLPRWCGLGLIIIPPLAMFYVGLLGLLWLALGYVLWLRRGAVAEQPSRVR